MTVREGSPAAWVIRTHRCFDAINIIQELRELANIWKERQAPAWHLRATGGLHLREHPRFALIPRAHTCWLATASLGATHLCIPNSFPYPVTLSSLSRA